MNYTEHILYNNWLASNCTFEAMQTCLTGLLFCLICGYTIPIVHHQIHQFRMNVFQPF
ncbi:hypothetical protein BDV23DRAFT_150299 [Aspergillus alliaceus]|uniref:Uncharacterized protein n=1 Tax=Petromyces alliaceus TaxID=209559 RepID=A0A5N7CGL3_PETAA|nr:hypothetical protein BDV23DRAFT_150299 [Aspergillus alliaceus]